LKQYLELFMEKTGLPEDSREPLFRAAEVLFSGEAGRAMETAVRRFYADAGLRRLPAVGRLLRSIAEKTGVHAYTVDFLFFVSCSEQLRERYRAWNLPEEIFWDSMKDLRYKLLECREVHGVWGTFVGSWFPMFFTLERFALGRMQYEYASFPRAYYEKAGVTLRRGDPVYNMHIPSAGPLTRESRMDSYRRAYRFFERELDGRPLPIVCHSWLLFPKNEEFFPAGSNLVDFLHDFDIIDTGEQDKFWDGWRVFGHDWELPPEQLPRRTSLQRGCADWLKAGRKTGEGFGVLLFDGEKIL
jgi:hypothetical protein